eukprot:TRINITY_DN6086_c0_g1_i2.p1 TRINITY_DN6086_c0_g1~~TRINITY_DN6086_c0_g1_i2.p1  ORF type:complete len:509 (-),score=120.70 TRINITY_DN6086_c0_g1_i2:344-1801(-)
MAALSEECSLPDSTQEQGDDAEIDKLEELLSLERVISAFLDYPAAAEEEVQRWESSFTKLRSGHKDLLAHLPSKFAAARRCIACNAFTIHKMLEAFEPPFFVDDIIHDTTSTRKRDNNEWRQLPWLKKWPRWFLSEQRLVPQADVDKVRCVLRSIVRDWTKEGSFERDQCYRPILEELSRMFPDLSGPAAEDPQAGFDREPNNNPRHSQEDRAALTSHTGNKAADSDGANGHNPEHCQGWTKDKKRRRQPTCLVPGAGLARLALEVSRLGFVCQGNEFSYYMLLCSGFILNRTLQAGEWTICPWVLDSCNSLTDQQQLSHTLFPDILPADSGVSDGFSMCAGSFLEVYNNESQIGAWDCVVTCFFLDTAHNIIDYIETISRILPPGGVWVNLGPLLYHFADGARGGGGGGGGFDPSMSMELSLEDVRRIAHEFGFRMERESFIETTYTANLSSLMRTQYVCAFWTMVKTDSQEDRKKTAGGKRES